MFCNQCEQAQNGTGCTEYGVCGKDADVQSLQETLLYGLKGMAAYAHHARRLGRQELRAKELILYRFPPRNDRRRKPSRR